MNQKYKTEAPLTKKVKEFLDKQPDVMYYKASERFVNGVSDIIACCKGIFVAIELKAESNKATPHQLNFIRKIQEAGGVGGVCYTVGEVSQLLEKARNSK